jgi:hypothetical protein
MAFCDADLHTARIAGPPGFVPGCVPYATAGARLGEADDCWDLSEENLRNDSAGARSNILSCGTRRSTPSAVTVLETLAIR